MEFNGTTPPTYSMKQVPIGGERNIEKRQQVNALLTRLKKLAIPTSIAGQQTHYKVGTNKASQLPRNSVQDPRYPRKKPVASLEVTAATDITEQLTMETDVQNGLLESLQKELHTQSAMTD